MSGTQRRQIIGPDCDERLMYKIRTTPANWSIACDYDLVEFATQYVAVKKER